MSLYDYCVSVKPIDFFQASEEVDEAAVASLVHTILESGVWKAPVPVEASSGIVMDGNHRVRAALLLGLRYLPCVLLRYDDSRVTVHDWKAGTVFDVEEIRRKVGNRQLLAYKTTRHSFNPPLPRSEIPLALLIGADARPQEELLRA